MLFQFVFLKQDVNLTYFFGKTSFFIQSTINQAVVGSSYMVQVVSSFFNQLRIVWISDETLFRVFDKASQSMNNSKRNSKEKFTEFYDN